MGMKLPLLPLLLALPAFPLLAEEPWSVDARHPVVTAPAPAAVAAKPSIPARAIDAVVGFYQHRISPLDGPRCPLYPTCSAYSRECLRRHGFLMGLLMTVDRLLQEGEVLVRAPRIRAFGFWRGFDPVEVEDFWWSRRRERTPKPRPDVAGPVRRQAPGSCVGAG